MIKNYFLVAWRNIRQSPLYAFINVFSIAIGLTCWLIIYLFIHDEKNFDAFHSRKDNIYRLNQIDKTDGEKVVLSMPPMGHTMLREFPEVVSYTRYHDRGRQLLKQGDKAFLIPTLVQVDTSFLDIFDFEMLHGNRATALDEPNTVVMTEKTALKFYSNAQEAIGGTVTIFDKDVKITGIIKNVPENSHLQFDALQALDSGTPFMERFNNTWENFLITYFLLRPGTATDILEEKFPAFLTTHISDPEINNRIALYLQPLNEIHLGSSDIAHDYSNYRKFDGTYLDIFAVVGLFILFIAIVNFINLSTARASHRWKEVGVRKTIGARKMQLLSQFICESIVLCFFAVVLAGLLSMILIELVNDILARNLSMDFLIYETINILFIIIGTLILGTIAGIYPAFCITSFSMADVLKGDGKTNGSPSLFRSGLVVVQFSSAIGMIVSTILVTQQLAFMKNKNLGFDKGQMMLVDMGYEVSNKFEALRTELTRSPLVMGVTASGQRLGENLSQSEFKVQLHGDVAQISPSFLNVDYDYFSVYGIGFKEGTNYSRNTKGNYFIVNEAFVRKFDLKEPVGERIGHRWHHDDSLGSIIGVVRDFNFRSLHHEITPLVIVVRPRWGYEEMTVKIDGTRAREAIAFVKNVWERHVSYPFDYSFLDEQFEMLYRSDEQMSAAITVMAVVAVVISCMGLFGLAALTTQRKTKEIGIRKVLGATSFEIAALLSKNFTRLILVSFLVASPVTYLLLSRWLENFAYRISIHPLFFLAGGIMALTIALMTISFHTLRSARANPVRALRYE